VSSRAARVIAPLFFAAAGSTPAAFAQTAADGYSIYQNGIYKGQPLPAPAPPCATCHGPDPRNSFIPQILIAAGNPDVLPAAWMLSPMTQFNYTGKIDANGRQGIATYLLYPDAGTKPFSLFAAQSLDFGSVTIGQSVAKTMMLTNIGAQDLAGVVIQASPSATGVTQTNDCPATLASQAACTVTVTFAPLAEGTANAGYVVSANNDANTDNQFFVFAAGATSVPPPPAAPAPAPPPVAQPPAASYGGGGAMDWMWPVALLLLQRLARWPRVSFRAYARDSAARCAEIPRLRLGLRPGMTRKKFSIARWLMSEGRTIVNKNTANSTPRCCQTAAGACGGVESVRLAAKSGMLDRVDGRQRCCPAQGRGPSDALAVAFVLV
jgi:hypothetical protein